MPLALPTQLVADPGAQRNFDALEGLLVPKLVSALPSAPVDGQEVYYVADATNGVVWHLRYRAASPSAYKWEFAGGPPLHAEVETEQGLSSPGSWLDLATVGPDVTLPRAGDYMVSWGCYSYWDGAAGANGVTSMGIQRGGVNPVATDRGAWSASRRNSAGVIWGSVYRSQRLTGATAAMLLRARYHHNNSNSSWGSRFLQALPVRLG